MGLCLKDTNNFVKETQTQSINLKKGLNKKDCYVKVLRHHSKKPSSQHQQWKILNFMFSFRVPHLTCQTSIHHNCPLPAHNLIIDEKWKQYQKWKNLQWKLGYFNQFVPSAPFLYPLKTSENFTVFWCFQGVERKGALGTNGLKNVLIKSVKAQNQVTYLGQMVYSLLKCKHDHFFKYCQ